MFKSIYKILIKREEPAFMVLRENKEQPEVKVALARLSLNQAESILRDLSATPLSDLSELRSVENPEGLSQKSLYDLLLQRSKGENLSLDSRGYLGYLTHGEAYNVLGRLELEMLEPMNFIRMLEVLKKGIDKEIKIEDEHGKYINPKLLKKSYDDIFVSNPNELKPLLDPDIFGTVAKAEKNPYRAEWLNSRSVIRHGLIAGGLHRIIRKKLNKGNSLFEIEEPLDEDTLMEKYRYIIINDLSKYTTKQGYPRKDIPFGSLQYYSPLTNDFAMVFLSNIKGNELDCNYNPILFGGGLGVRAQVCKK